MSTSSLTDILLPKSGKTRPSIPSFQDPNCKLDDDPFISHNSSFADPSPKRRTRALGWQDRPRTSGLLSGNRGSPTTEQPSERIHHHERSLMNELLKTDCDTLRTPMRTPRGGLDGYEPSGTTSGVEFAYEKEGSWQEDDDGSALECLSESSCPSPTASISSLLIRTDRLPPEPLKTRIITLLAWQFLFSVGLCLPLLFFTIFVPFLNLITIPLLVFFVGVLFFNITFLAYLSLAQVDPPPESELPFLPYFDLWLCARVNIAVFRWLRTGFRVFPRIVTDWCVRRVLAARNTRPDWVRTDIHYGSVRPGKRLDVYRAQSLLLPSTSNSVGALTEEADLDPVQPSPNTLAAQLHEENQLRVWSSTDVVKSEPGTLAPIVIFIHSPNLGPFQPKKWMYESLGRNLSSLMGYCVVIPDITWFPEGRAKDMVEDVRRVMRWVRENGRKYGGDIERIYLMGHSLGATLSLLTVLQEAVVISRDTLLRFDPHAEIANGLRKLEIYAPEAIIPQIQGMILFAPICDVDNHMFYESERGVEHISKIRRVLGPSHTTAMFHSPAHILHASRNVVNIGLLPPKILFIHGGVDHEVHHFQSEQMKELMRGVGVVDTRLRVYPAGHLDVITSLMMNMDEPLSDQIREELRKFIPL